MHIHTILPKTRTCTPSYTKNAHTHRLTQDTYTPSYTRHTPSYTILTHTLCLTQDTHIHTVLHKTHTYRLTSCRQTASGRSPQKGNRGSAELMSQHHSQHDDHCQCSQPRNERDELLQRLLAFCQVCCFVRLLDCLYTNIYVVVCWLQFLKKSL